MQDQQDPGRAVFEVEATMVRPDGGDDKLRPSPLPAPGANGTDASTVGCPSVALDMRRPGAHSGAASGGTVDDTYRQQGGGVAPVPAPVAAQRERSLAETTASSVYHEHSAHPMAHLHVSIEAGFRKKMLAILSMQLIYTVGLASGLRFATGLGDFLEDHIPVNGSGATPLYLFLAILFGLPFLSLAKDRHPWNMVAMWVWSTLFAVFLAVSDMPHAENPGSKYHAFLMIFYMLTGGIVILTLVAQIKLCDYDSYVLLGFGKAGCIGWLIWMPVACVIFSEVRDDVDWQVLPEDEDDFTPIAPFAVSVIVASLIYMWFCFEASRLCDRMQPDEYMKGVIYFYTDMFYVCGCCALLACLGGGGGGAPPSEEEER